MKKQSTANGNWWDWFGRHKNRRKVKGESNAKTISCKWELVGLVWSPLRGKFL